MATEHVDQNKQPEQVSSSSEWSAATSRMVIEFYKENRALWDRNHKDYGKNSVQKKLFTPLVAKLTRSNVPKSEPAIKKRWHYLHTSASLVRHVKFGTSCRFVASCASAFMVFVHGVIVP